MVAPDRGVSLAEATRRVEAAGTLVSSRLQTSIQAVPATAAMRESGKALMRAEAERQGLKVPGCA